MKVALKIAWGMLKSGKFKLRYIWDFLVGSYRVARARPRFDGNKIVLDAPQKVRQHIAEQFLWRVNEKTDKTCLRNFSCKHCGCSVPDLQFANRECEGGCYPKMMNKKEWREYVR
jgi:hypothetical protein